MIVNNKTPLVSIIAPCYKVEDYLSNCIKSVISQTYENWELILVDDGSPDKCGQICDDYAIADSRIKVVHKSNGGLSSARNAGLEIFNGDYVTFLDTDDFWHIDYLKILLNLAINNNADIAQCDFLLGEANEFPIYKRKINVRNYDNHSIFVDRAAKIVMWGKLYKSSLFDDIRMPVGLVHEDDWTTWKLYYKANKIFVTNAALYYYTYNRNGIMATKQRVPDLTYFGAYQERIMFFHNRREKDLEDISRMQCCLSILGLYSHPMLSKDQRKKIKQIYDENWVAIRKSLVVPKLYKIIFFFFYKASFISVVIKYYKMLRKIR